MEPWGSPLFVAFYSLISIETSWGWGPLDSGEGEGLWATFAPLRSSYGLVLRFTAAGYIICCIFAFNLENISAKSKLFAKQISTWILSANSTKKQMSSVGLEDISGYYVHGRRFCRHNGFCQDNDCFLVSYQHKQCFNVLEFEFLRLLDTNCFLYISLIVWHVSSDLSRVTHLPFMQCVSVCKQNYLALSIMWTTIWLLRKLKSKTSSAFKKILYS